MGIEVKVLRFDEKVPMDETFVEFRPTEFYTLPNGTSDEQPSYVFVGTRPDINVKIIMQISNRMLCDVLNSVNRIKRESELN